MTLGANEAYCTGCGKPRPIIGSTPDGEWFTRVDERYVNVACGSVQRPGVFDRAKARQIIKDRRARAKAKRLAREGVRGLPTASAVRQIDRALGR